MKILLCSTDSEFMHSLQQQIDPFATLTGCDSIASSINELASGGIDLFIYHLNEDSLTSQTMFSLLRFFPDHKIVCLAEQLENNISNQLLAAGVKGAVTKQELLANTQDVIDIVLFGGIYISKAIRSQMRSATQLENESQTQPSAIDEADTHSEKPSRKVADFKLTPRQLEIIDFVLKGWSNKDIAKQLAIKEGTVKTHLGMIFRVLNISNRGQIFKYRHTKFSAVN